MKKKILDACINCADCCNGGEVKVSKKKNNIFFGL